MPIDAIPSKKLSLRKETLVRLDGRSLEHVNGGALSLFSVMFTCTIYRSDRGGDTK